ALSSSLTALSVALGVMLMVAVLVIFGVVRESFNQSASGYDFVVGPKGSRLQLVLNTVFRVGAPIENLPWSFYEHLQKDRRLEEVVPFALGDVTEEGSFPIVGTTSRYFEIEYMPKKQFRIRGNRMTNAFDAVIGSQVARQNGWDLGSEFKLIHGGAETGHVHDEKFTVVAVMAPTGTPNDKTCFVNLEGFYLVEGHDKPVGEAISRERAFWGSQMPADVKQTIAEAEARLAKNPDGDSHDHSAHDHSGHDHHDHTVSDLQKEVTALLVRAADGSSDNETEQVRRRFGNMQGFQAELQEGFQAQAVNPIREIRVLMDTIVGNVFVALYGLTILIIVVSGVGIFVSIYNSMSERKKEIAVMRALGARRSTVFSIILAESLLLCLVGGVLGILLGHGLVFAAAPLVESRAGIPLDPFAFQAVELVLLPGMIVLATLVGFLPGITAYRTDVASSLHS
ncbi:MAG: ABC transporter permease, partial [Planctomycetaceae bacterium]|nr:ABC transporter permease [Planctomycetaceae bacterium]